MLEKESEDNYEITSNYKCHECGAHDLKLWRECQKIDFRTKLFCAACAEKNQQKEHEENWKSQFLLGTGSGIGFLIPAIPKGENIFFGYSFIPESGMKWWKNLPKNQIKMKTEIKHFPDYEKDLQNYSVIFLAGPIKNAPKWRDEMINLFLEKNEAVLIASPEGKRVDVEINKLFPRRRAWEQYYLNLAANKKGCIVFWLPAESLEKQFKDKVYAHITMMELGEWIARKAVDPEINLIIGTDGYFPEWETIQYELETEIQDLEIFYSIEEVVNAVLKAVGK